MALLNSNYKKLVNNYGVIVSEINEKKRIESEGMSEFSENEIVDSDEELDDLAKDTEEPEINNLISNSQVDAYSPDLNLPKNIDKNNVMKFISREKSTVNPRDFASKSHDLM